MLLERIPGSVGSWTHFGTVRHLSRVASRSVSSPEIADRFRMFSAASVGREIPAAPSAGNLRMHFSAWRAQDGYGVMPPDLKRRQHPIDCFGRSPCHPAMEGDASSVAPQNEENIDAGAVKPVARSTGALERSP